MLEVFRQAVEARDEAAHAPVLFALGAPDHDAFAALCRAGGVRVLDTIERQLLEWARTELPSEPFGSQACRALIASELEASRATMTTYGVWCYYPWRSTVTHLLPKGHFVTVRTNRNRDKIKRDEQASMAQKRIGVAGLSVGHVAALVLAQERLCDELRIADFDQLDLSNINRLRTSVLNVGETKARLTAREIAEIDPYITVRVFPEGITENNLEGFLLEGGPLDLVVEECDSLPMKLRIRERAREHGIPVVMDTNDRGLVDIERFDLERARPLLHGLLGAHTAATVAGLDPAERLALFYDFFGGESEVSGAFRDSIRKIGRELVSYPQLASDVHLGGALVGHVVREIFLGRLTRSGRFAIDLHQLIDDGAAKLADAGGRPASRR